MGKYRLSEGFENHKIDPNNWREIDEQARHENQTFLLQWGKTSRLFQRRLKRATKVANWTWTFCSTKIDSDWQVTGDQDLLDPDANVVSSCVLVLRKDHSNCPKVVKRSETCTKRFEMEFVVVKTYGEHEFYNKKTGKNEKQNGNVYLHYNCASQNIYHSLHSPK